MCHAKPVTRVCGACCKTRLSGYNPGTLCVPCQRALFGQQNPAALDDRDDPATWVWDTGPMRDALARLDFPAVLVIYRSTARLSRRELGERTGLSESTIWRFEAGERQGIYDIRQLLQFADSVQMPRPALLPVILGQPRALDDLVADSAASLAAHAGGAGHD